jgi:hypothetical protein
MLAGQDAEGDGDADLGDGNVGELGGGGEGGGHDDAGGGDDAPVTPSPRMVTGSEVMRDWQTLPEHA